MFSHLETQVLAKWQANKTSQQLQAAASGPEFVFFEGPPTANGKPGVHHVLARTFKDFTLRYKTMNGYRVVRQGGWDCHGLPVELEVERELGLANKSEVERFGLEAFSERCRQSVGRYSEQWAAMSERMGYWLDDENTYQTMDVQYMDAVWQSLRRVWDNGLLYQGDKVVPFCPRCQTTLSSHELAQPGAYQDKESPSACVLFQLKDGNYLAAWTTTPWTLTANQGLAVNADFDYELVDFNGKQVFVEAQSALRSKFKGEVLDVVSGHDFVGKHYQGPLGRSGVVVAQSWVDRSAGTGVVHLAPAFGADDALALPDVLAFCPVGKDGVFVETAYQGLFYLEANDAALADVQTEDKLLFSYPYKHSLPHCWRCDTELLYMRQRSWYAAASQVQQQMTEQNQGVRWLPESVKEGRFGKWLQGNVDWALSRERYWGTPLPFWQCENGHSHCVGSKQELEQLTNTTLDDLHRASVDHLLFDCPDCQQPMTRVPEVLDVWYDSGVMPWARSQYFEQSQPSVADFVAEGVDQTRGWFYSMMAVSALMGEPVPYKNVMCLGLVVDEQGRKMSKSKGNVVDPFELFEQLGADPLRLFYLSKNPWEGYALDKEQVRKSGQMLVTLQSCLDFLLMLDDQHVESDTQMDLWLQARLQETVAQVSMEWDQYEYARGVATLEKFVEDLSNWWLRTQKERLYQGQGKQLLKNVLEVVAQLLAPATPFFAEHLYGSLGHSESVHSSAWPKPMTVDKPEAVDTVRALVELGRSARAQAKVTLKQPLAKASFCMPESSDFEEEMLALLKNELNVVELEFPTDSADLFEQVVVPNFKTLGPRFGSMLPAVKQALHSVGADEVQQLKNQGTFSLQVGGQTHSLGLEDVSLVSQALPNACFHTQGTAMVSLDLEPTDELRWMHWLRKAKSTVQAQRKAAGMQASYEHMTVAVSGNGPLCERVLENTWLAEETNATFVAGQRDDTDDVEFEVLT